MTPVQDWTYADYYAAIDRARWAWQQTQPQFVLFDAGALDDPQGFASAGGLTGDLRIVERVPPNASPFGGALQAGADPGHAPLQGQTDVPGRRVVDGQQPSSAPSLTTTGADASLPRLSASAPEEGA